MNIMIYAYYAHVWDFILIQIQITAMEARNVKLTKFSRFRNNISKPRKFSASAMSVCASAGSVGASAVSVCASAVSVGASAVSVGASAVSICPSALLVCSDAAVVCARLS